MKRWLFNILTGLSLILFAATIALWSCSVSGLRTLLDTTPLGPGIATRTNGYSIHVHRGTISFNVVSGHRPMPLQFKEGLREYGGEQTSYFWNSLGLSYSESDLVKYSVETLTFQPGSYGNRKVFSVMLAWPLLFSLPLTVWFFQVGLRRWVRQRMIYALRHCATCGYNLTGNVSGVCPECGTVIPHRVNAQSPPETV